MKVWVLMAESGEYSDASHEVVGVFSSSETAGETAKKIANEFVAEYNAKNPSSYEQLTVGEWACGTEPWEGDWGLEIEGNSWGKLHSFEAHAREIDTPIERHW